MDNGDFAVGNALGKDDAVFMNDVTFGLAPIRPDWLQSGFEFRNELSYGLKTLKNNTKSLITYVTAHILKYLLFKQDSNLKLHFEEKLRPTQNLQKDALVNSLSEILWRAGDVGKTCICLPNVPKWCPYRFIDQLVVYKFTKYDELVQFIGRYLSVFSSGCGCLIFLYSLILTKGKEKLKEESKNEESLMLLSSTGDCTMSALNLILTGIATPYLHNGIAYISEQDEGATKELLGIEKRSEIGLLLWQTNDGTHSTQIGSRLKTPSLPIWITCVNGQYGILFNPNQDLTRDYHAERRFDLHYYSSVQLQIHPTILNIDTRYATLRTENIFHPPLASLILTKWQGAQIDWNGQVPFV